MTSLMLFYIIVKIRGAAHDIGRKLFFFPFFITIVYIFLFFDEANIDCFPI